MIKLRHGITGLAMLADVFVILVISITLYNGWLLLPTLALVVWFKEGAFMAWKPSNMKILKERGL